LTLIDGVNFCRPRKALRSGAVRTTHDTEPVGVRERCDPFIDKPMRLSLLAKRATCILPATTGSHAAKTKPTPKPSDVSDHPYQRKVHAHTANLANAEDRTYRITPVPHACSMNEERHELIAKIQQNEPRGQQHRSTTKSQTQPEQPGTKKNNRQQNRRPNKNHVEKKNKKTKKQKKSRINPPTLSHYVYHQEQPKKTPNPKQ